MVKNIDIYKSMKSFILNNQLLPGERLYLQGLSKSLDISITPLREALNRLVQEGYIDHVSNRGYTIRSITASEIDKFYEVCEALESYAIKLAVNNITQSVLAELRENLEDYKKSLLAPFSRERFALNNQFHLKIASLSENKIITENLEKIFEKIMLKWKMENITEARIKAYEEHMAIYDSLEKKDATNAVINMEIHITNTKKFVSDMFKMKESLFQKS